MVDKSKFVNHFEMTAPARLLFDRGWDLDPLPDYLPNGALVLSHLIPSTICGVIRQQLARNAWLAVGLDGRANHTYDEIGNYRLSNWNEELASAIGRKIIPLLPKTYKCSPETPTDHDNHELWRPHSVGSLFRYIRYAEGGKLVGHYDETFVQNDDCRSLMSLVIYLTTNERGATRFLRDPQYGKRMDEMDFRDWDRAGNPDEVLLSIPPQEGCALIFPHRLLHDSEPLLAGDPEKIIIRTDIFFERL